MVIAEFDRQHPDGHVVAGNTPSGHAEHAKHAAKDAGQGVKDTVEGRTASSSEMPEFKSVHRVGNIPVVADSVQVFENIVKSTHFTAAIYDTTCGLAMKFFDHASPLISRGKPFVDKADSMVNSGLDFVESRYPYPFKASTGEMVDTVKQPVVGAYDQRIAPIMHTELVQRAIDQLYQLNASLARYVQDMLKPELERAAAWMSKKGDQAAEGAGAVVEKAGDTANGTSDRLSDAAGKAQSEAGRASGKAQNKAGDAVDSVKGARA